MHWSKSSFYIEENLNIDNQMIFCQSKQSISSSIKTLDQYQGYQTIFCLIPLYCIVNYIRFKIENWSFIFANPWELFNREVQWCINTNVVIKLHNPLPYLILQIPIQLYLLILNIFSFFLEKNDNLLSFIIVLVDHCVYNFWYYYLYERYPNR